MLFQPRAVLIPGLIVAATLMAYLPAILHGGWVWDDDQHVTASEVLWTPGGLRRIWLEPRSIPQYYPLTHTSFWIDFRLWRLNPRGYHLENVLLHAANAVLVGLALRRLRVAGAWLAAAVFALHPVHVETVAWITERKNVLSGLFFLIALLAYLRFAALDSPPTPGTDQRATPRRWGWYALSTGAFVCALLSKTVTCTLPAVLMLLIWWKRPRLRWPEIWPLLPMLILGLLMGGLTVWLERTHVGAEGFEWSLSATQKLLLAGRIVWFYAASLVWPLDLAFVYPRWDVSSWGPTHALYPLAGLGAVAMLWALRGRIGRGPLVAVLFFGGTLFPALGFFHVYPMRYSYVADHFQYLASIGLIALLCSLIARGSRRVGQTLPRGTRSRVAALGSSPAAPVVRAGLTLVLTGALATLTWRQCHDYESDEVLWRNTIVKSPGAFLAHSNLAVILQSRGDLEQASAHYRVALRSRPDHAESLYNLGSILVAQGRDEEGAALLEHALRLAPDYPVAPFAYYNLAVLCARRERFEDAAAHYALALAHNADFEEARRALGTVLLRLIDETSRSRVVSQVVRRSGKSQPEVLEALATAYAAVNHYAQAASLVEHALQIARSTGPDGLVRRLEDRLRDYQIASP